MELGREIWEFTRTDLGRLLRSGKGAVLLILYGLVQAAGGVIFALVARSQVGEALSRGMLALLASGGDQALAEKLSHIPASVLFAYWFSLLVLPLLVLFMGFDQISGELSTRSVRYLAFRSRRVSWALGKALAQALALFGLSFAANLVVLGFAIALVPNAEPGATLRWVMELWLLSGIYGLAYVGLITLISALFRTPFTSLIAGAVALVVMGILRLMAAFSSALEPLRYALPGTYASHLLSTNPTVTAGSVAVLLGFAAVFLIGAMGVLRARDL